MTSYQFGPGTCTHVNFADAEPSYHLGSFDFVNNTKFVYVKSQTIIYKGDKNKEKLHTVKSVNNAFNYIDDKLKFRCIYM